MNGFFILSLTRDDSRARGAPDQDRNAALQHRGIAGGNNVPERIALRRAWTKGQFGVDWYSKITI